MTSLEANVSSTLLSYDVAADEWAELPPPPVGDLVATGDELVVFAPSHESHGAGRHGPADPLPPDVVFDSVAESWVELPADPHRPSYDRMIVATDAGLVLLARDLVADPGADPPIVRAAVLDSPGDLATGRWSTLLVTADHRFDGPRLPGPLAHVPSDWAPSFAQRPRVRPGTGTGKAGGERPAPVAEICSCLRNPPSRSAPRVSSVAPFTTWEAGHARSEAAAILPA